MKRIKWILIPTLGIGVLVATVMFWVRPERVDMAGYAPANSLLYMEANDPLAVVNTIFESDAWKLSQPASASSMNTKDGWLRRLMRTTGIGPVQSVVLSRAQIAIVVTDLGTTEDGQTLRVKPEFAVIVETHTSETRIRSFIEEALKQLAESTYDQPTLRRTTVNGVEFVEWRNQQGSRQIVAAIVGSLVVVGNSEPSVQRCLDSARGQSPSLKEDANLHRFRRELAGNETLSFGYVPESKSAQLLSFAVPLFLGRAPDDAGFQRLVSTAASRLFGSIAWSSKPFRQGVEDKYLISLQPNVLRQLQPTFKPRSSKMPLRLLPEDTYSLSYYSLENPLAAWEDLKTAVAANTDALSAVVFSSLLKASLLSYGITEPEAFLKNVSGDILTLRLDQNGDQTLLVAKTTDVAAVRAVILKNMKVESNSKPTGAESFADADGVMGAAIVGDIVVMGLIDAVRGYSATLMQSTLPPNEAQLKRMTSLLPLDSSSPIATYTDDRDRVRRFWEAVHGSSPNQVASMELALLKLPYAATQTKLNDAGVERITRSPLGQFSSLLPLLIPERRSTTLTTPSR